MAPNRLPTMRRSLPFKAIRDLYKGKDSKLGSYKIGGVVISDALNKNISSGSVVLQDGDRGISVYFGGTVSYNIGDSIVLDITGDSLINYRGSLEIKTIYGTAKPTPVATNKTVFPVEINVQNLSAALSDIEFTLIKIKSATASGAVSFGGKSKTERCNRRHNFIYFKQCIVCCKCIAVRRKRLDWLRQFLWRHKTVSDTKYE